MSASNGQPKRLQLRRQLRLERLSDRRVLAAITGVVFEDANLSLQQEQSEAGLDDRVVYLDTSLNGILDPGEIFTTTDESGNFSFENLDNGDYSLRVYSGTDSQEQVFPATPVDAGEDIEIQNPVDLVLTGDSPIALTEQTVEFGSFITGQSQSFRIGDNLVDSQILPDGTILVIGGTGAGDTAWNVNPEYETADTVDLSGGSSGKEWTALAIDGQGHGLVISREGPLDASIRSVDASDATGGITTADTGITVPIDARAISSASGNRSVLAWAGSNGLEVSLWSNSTGTFITGSSIEIADTNALLAFDDASGILVLRTTTGGLSVHDVDGNFATLATIDQPKGAVALDGERSLLVAMAENGDAVEFYGAATGKLLDAVPLLPTAAGNVSQIAYVGARRELTLLGDEGLTRIAFTDPASRQISVENGIAPESTTFGIEIVDTNEAPRLNTTNPSYTVNEDFTLVVGTPGVLSSVVDFDSDSFISILTEPTFNGSLNLRTDGSLTYIPNANFHGFDQFKFVAHDGRDRSEEIVVNITVNSIPDPPTDIDVNADPINENAAGGEVVGDVIIVDGDLDNDHNVGVLGGPFNVIDGQLIFVGGDLNFEVQPEIQLTITVEDLLTSTTLVETVTIFVADVNEPITGIIPGDARVSENLAGAVIATLMVVDEDLNSDPEFSVDDSRFVIENHTLRLADGVSLDHEQTPVVRLNVTATDGDSYSQEILIHVMDVPEQPTNISLTSQDLLELVPGAEVGRVLVDGNDVADNYIVAVDDPRFEIVQGILKLNEDEWVERSDQEQIQLTITVRDAGQTLAAVSRQFVLEVRRNDSPYHNEQLPYDVNKDGRVSASDALAIINYLNTYGPGPVGSGDPGYAYDVNDDQFVTALDALLVMNELNRLGNSDGGTVGGEEPEGEFVPDPDRENPLDPVNAPSGTVDHATEDTSSFGTLQDESSASELPSLDEDSEDEDGGSTSLSDAVDAALTSLESDD